MRMSRWRTPRTCVDVVPVPDDRPRAAAATSACLVGDGAKRRTLGLEPEPPVPAPAVPLDEGARQRRPGDEERPQPSPESSRASSTGLGAGGLVAAPFSARFNTRDQNDCGFECFGGRRRRVAPAARRPGSDCARVDTIEDSACPPPHRREQRDDGSASCWQSSASWGGCAFTSRMCRSSRDAARSNGEKSSPERSFVLQTPSPTLV